MNRFLKSVGFAFSGLQLMLQEPNFRIQLVAAVLVICTSFFLHITSTEWIILIGCIGMVMAAEVFNTAVEQLCNMTEPNIHPLIKKIKDTSAAAVLILALVAAICGSIVLLPKIIFTIQMYVS
ncbi:MAG: diacylglycerol kinase family protein [Ferruginibacter sp.]